MKSGISDGLILGLRPKPRQRDIVPLESHFSTNDSLIRAEIEFFALFVCEHAKRNKSFAQAFSKACGVQRRRLWSLSADSEIPPPSKRSGGGLGEPYQGVPPYYFGGLKGNPSLGFPLFDCSAIKFTLSCVLEGGGVSLSADSDQRFHLWTPQAFEKA